MMHEPHEKAVERLTRHIIECVCGHLHYSHRLMGLTLACTVLDCRCTAYQEKIS